MMENYNTFPKGFNGVLRFFCQNSNEFNKRAPKNWRVVNPSPTIAKKAWNLKSPLTCFDPLIVSGMKLTHLPKEIDRKSWRLISATVSTVAHWELKQ